jgi:hypothetical protein
MQTIKWGPGLWVGLHCMTYNYPLEPTQSDKDHYKIFFDYLQYMLPCIYCRQSYTTYLNYLPIDKFLNDRHGVTYWLYSLHNLVNQKLQKPMIDFTECCVQYEKMRAKCGKVIENDAKYIECVKEVEKINCNDVKKFVSETENKYKSLVNKYVQTLMSSPDNPNKECNICKHKIYYDRY